MDQAQLKWAKIVLKVLSSEALGNYNYMMTMMMTKEVKSSNLATRRFTTLSTLSGNRLVVKIVKTDF